MSKRYLGDSVYVEYQGGGMVTLTTENGMGASNVIHLEPEVFDALAKYVENIRQTEREVIEAAQTIYCSHCSANIGPVPERMLLDPIARRSILDNGRLCSACYERQESARNVVES